MRIYCHYNGVCNRNALSLRFAFLVLSVNVRRARQVLVAFPTFTMKGCGEIIFSPPVATWQLRRFEKAPVDRHNLEATVSQGNRMYQICITSSCVVPRISRHGHSFQPCFLVILLLYHWNRRVLYGCWSLRKQTHPMQREQGTLRSADSVDCPFSKASPRLYCIRHTDGTASGLGS